MTQFINFNNTKKKEIPPCRFVTDLSQGVTARSDTFLVNRWLGPLTKDYCKDLVKDTTAALKTLDELEKITMSMIVGTA